jgi:threonine 3-dehydrogenase
MAMPDAINALIDLEAARKEDLSKLVYNVTSFSLTADQFLEQVRGAFEDVQVDFESDRKREAIVDSWPADMDSSAAEQDWGWEPEYDLRRAFDDYLVPNIRQRYAADPV